MNGNEQQLPPGWVCASLGDIVEPRSGKANPQDIPDGLFIGMEQIEAHTMRLLCTVPCSTMKSSANVFFPSDVLYGRLRSYLNKVYQPDFEGLCSGEFIVFPESSAVLGRFLKYRLNASDFVNYASHINTGDRPRVDYDQIKVFPILLPPKNEQLRIADALDELFSDLDVGVEALTRVREKLKLYRASALKSAVEGELTAEWRSHHKDVEPATELIKRILDERRRRWEEEQLRKYKEKGQEPPKGWKAKYKEPASADTSNLSPLPDGWCWATLDQVGRLDRGRSKHRPRDAKFLYSGPYPFIQTGDVRKARQYLREHSQTYSEAGLLQSRLWPTETLCITIAANIAETAILAYPACFPDSIVGVILEPSLVSVRYVELFMRSARSRISAYAPATAQKNINNEILRAVAIPLPPLQEQLAIVDTVEDQLSMIDHIDDELEIKSKNSQALRQAILRHAFTGQLVPQDANDESASKLLKRVTAERETRAREAAVAKRASRTASTLRTRSSERARTSGGRRKKIKAKEK